MSGDLISQPPSSRQEVGDSLLSLRLRWSRLSPRARFMLSSGALLTVLLIVLVSLTQKPSATLDLTLRHSFRNAHLSVWIDDRLVHEKLLTGSESKKFGVFGRKVEGSYSKTLGVSAGHHVLRVQITAPDYDQSTEASIVAAAGNPVAVSINATRGELALNTRSASRTLESNSGLGIPPVLGSLVLTITGSALSACIGFFIQEFLRGRKAKIRTLEARPADAAERA